jgi:glycosyltransferase involved in cell wall biosynthesis
MSEILDAVNQAVEYAIQGKYHKQKDVCEKYLKKAQDTKKADVRIFRAFFYAGLMDAYLQLKQYDRVGPVFAKAVEDPYCNDFAKTYFYGCMTIAAAYRGEFTRAREYVRKYKAGLKELMQQEELVQSIYFIRDVCTVEFYEKVDDAIYRDARPLEPRASSSDSLKLSITLMTSNRKDTIRKCLDSMQHLREVVPSELVIVDTGCDEEMRHIIESYTDKIVKFEWCNDFSAARNAGLARCTGNWFMFIDDDEWFEDTTAIEEFFLSGEYKKYNKAFYNIRNYGDMEGKSYADNEVMRLCVLTDETHFRGKIHEQLQPYYEDAAHLDSFVHHYGYAYETEEERIRHGYRNIVPMIEAVEEEPYDLNMKIHLAHGFFNTSEYKSLLDLCEGAIKQITNPEDPYVRKYYSGFCGGYIDALCYMGFYEKTISECNRLLKTPLTKMGQLTLYRWKAHAAYRLKLVNVCKDAIAHYESLMEEFDRDPESFYMDRMHMTEGALQEREAIEATKVAVSDGMYYETDRDIARKSNYARMAQLEVDGSDDRELMLLYYIESELCLQEKFCKKRMKDADEDYAFYRLGYVDAIFTQCRYDVALNEIKIALQDNGVSDADRILLYCEGCLSAFRQKEYTLAHDYGVSYQKALAEHGDQIDQNNLILVAAIQEFNQKKVQDILDMLIPQSQQTANDEMQQLAQRIKIQAKQMIDAGDLITAKSVLSQLLVMIPNDEEAKRMLEMCS